MKKRLPFAGLIFIFATFFGSRWAMAQQAPSTEIAGGRGGNAFMDPEPEQGTRVVEVLVRSGDHLDSVQLVYMLSDGQTVSGPQHGGPGGVLNVFHLDADEYLIGISGRSGSYIDSIQFETNKRTSATFGGRGGDRDFRLEVPANAQVSGLTGRAGQYVDAIGLTFMPIRRWSDSSYERAPYGSAPQPGHTSLAGGSGGSDFFDSDIPEGARIIEVRVEAGEFIDAVQMVYSVPYSRPLEAAKHGGEGGRAASFRLGPGEYVVALSGRCGRYVDSLRIHTNLRTSPLFGGSGGDRDFRIDVPEGTQATGFTGRSGMYLDAIGLTYARIPDANRGLHDRHHER